MPELSVTFKRQKYLLVLDAKILIQFRHQNNLLGLDIKTICEV